MTRRYICQLGENENVDEVFLAAEKQMRPNRAGSLYLQLRLTDRSGAITGMLWNASHQVYGSFETGDFVRVQGNTQYHNGGLQIIVKHVSRIDPGTINESEFHPLGTADIDRLGRRLAEMLRSMRNVHLRNLAEVFLGDEVFLKKFCRAPAGVKNHHAYLGGLIEHVVGLMELVLTVATHYDLLDSDLLLMGAFLHDIGKIEELSYDREFGYSDEGQLIGHVVMAVGMLESRLAETARLAGEPFPAELALRLKHMIVSHHGHYEYGSPKLPMTLEAVALHQLDDLDAKLHSFSRIMEEDVNTDSHWTVFQPGLGRKLFKGGG